MNVLVCVKRVAMVGSRIVLTADARERGRASTGLHDESPRGVRGRRGNTDHRAPTVASVTVMTLGPSEASEQLRDAASLGATKLVHLVSDGSEWDAVATAEALVSAVWSLEADGGPFDLILFGNEAADTGDYQVGVRVAQALGRPSLSGVKHLEVGEHSLEARREYRGGEELYEIALPCVVAVKEGINLPALPLASRAHAREESDHRRGSGRVA